MRRKDREITADDARRLLGEGEYGILSTVDADGRPYGIPLSYAFLDGRIYFHCALEGRKLDHLEANPRVSFCVVGRTKVLPAQFATEYESTVVDGIAREVRGAEKHAALMGLLEKYSPEFMEEGRRYIGKKEAATRVFRIDIKRLTGKARR